MNIEYSFIGRSMSSHFLSRLSCAWMDIYVNERATYYFVIERRINVVSYLTFRFDFLLTKETCISRFLKETISRDE